MIALSPSVVTVIPPINIRWIHPFLPESRNQQPLESTLAEITGTGPKLARYSVNIVLG